MPFAVVVFPAASEVEVIPLCWLTADHKKAYWPSFATLNGAKKAILKESKPDRTWQLHDARVLNIYETYALARAKLKDAENTSDLNSDAETKQRKKRKQKEQESSFCSDFSDESDSAAGTPSCKLPRPPMISFVRAEPQQILNQDICDFGASPLHASSSKTVNASGTEYTGENFSRNCSQRNVDVEILGSKEDRDAENKLCLRTLQAILTYVKHNRDRLDHLQMQMNSMSETLAAMRTGPLSVPVVTSQALNLPLESIEEVNSLEAKLAEDVNLSVDLCNLLYRSVSDCISSSIKRMLRVLMTDEVAAQFSWFGKQKKAFVSLKITAEIFRAIRKSPCFANCRDIDVEVVIKSWLRHAGERGRSSRRNKE